MSTVALLYSDGASRGNPGPAGAGVVLTDPSGVVIQTGHRYLGKETNNRAEYQALILGLELAAASNISVLTCYLDSELVVQQLCGVYRVRNARLLPLYERALALCRSFTRCTFRHVGREHNALADRLANQAIDEHTAPARRT